MTIAAVAVRALDVTSPSSSRVTVVGARTGDVLPAGPLLQRGQPVTGGAWGFAPSGAVMAALAGGGRSARCDRTGPAAPPTH
jgi:hypothetical protein